jgi:hypothetical protein
MPSHVTSYTTSRIQHSTIDLVLSSGVYVLPLTVRGRLGTGSTDHCPVLAIIALPRQAAPKGKVFIASRYRLKTAIRVEAQSMLRGNACVAGPVRGSYECRPIRQSLCRSDRTDTQPVDAARSTATAAIHSILDESYGEIVKGKIAIIQDCENKQNKLGTGGMATNTPSHQKTFDEDEDQTASRSRTSDAAGGSLLYSAGSIYCDVRRHLVTLGVLLECTVVL